MPDQPNRPTTFLPPLPNDNLTLAQHLSLTFPNNFTNLPGPSPHITTIPRVPPPPSPPNSPNTPIDMDQPHPNWIFVNSGSDDSDDFFDSADRYEDMDIVIQDPSAVFDNNGRVLPTAEAAAWIDELLRRAAEGVAKSERHQLQNRLPRLRIQNPPQPMPLAMIPPDSPPSSPPAPLLPPPPDIKTYKFVEFLYDYRNSFMSSHSIKGLIITEDLQDLLCMAGRQAKSLILDPREDIGYPTDSDPGSPIDDSSTDEETNDDYEECDSNGYRIKGEKVAIQTGTSKIWAGFIIFIVKRVIKCQGMVSHSKQS